MTNSSGFEFRFESYDTVSFLMKLFLKFEDILRLINLEEETRDLTY